MGTDPRYVTSNRNTGREMRKDEEGTDVNEREIRPGIHTGNQTLGTNFSHARKTR